MFGFGKSEAHKKPVEKEVKLPPMDQMMANNEEYEKEKGNDYKVADSGPYNRRVGEAEKSNDDEEKEVSDPWKSDPGVAKMERHQFRDVA
ncbi:MAG: hypothetical protein H6782_02590 [Candidatus Nomurabacteria bacterium]|nr:MAG: hypothetical protein H6782_02590 [Candidatus Nomurabacteria bacterium]